MNGGTLLNSINELVPISFSILYNISIFQYFNPTPRITLSVRWFVRNKICRIIDTCIMDTCIMDTSAWVTRPERPKGAKDEVKEARRAADEKFGPGGPPKLLVYIYFFPTANLVKLSYFRHPVFISIEGGQCHQDLLIY